MCCCIARDEVEVLWSRSKNWFFQELVFSLEVADFKVNMISSQELNVSVSFQSYFSGSTCLRVFGNRCKVLDSKTFQSQLLSKVFPSPKIFGFRFGRFAMVFSIQNSRFKWVKKFRWLNLFYPKISARAQCWCCAAGARNTSSCCRHWIWD